MWNSFKKSARRFRSRSREKLSRSKGSKDESRLSARYDKVQVRNPESEATSWEKLLSKVLLLLNVDYEKH